MQKLKNSNMGYTLRALRKVNGYTQDQRVAKLNLMGIEINRNVYSRIETCELNIPVNLLVGLQEIYSCTFDDFFRAPEDILR